MRLRSASALVEDGPGGVRGEPGLHEHLHVGHLRRVAQGRHRQPIGLRVPARPRRTFQETLVNKN